jgi:uncharacterized phiE125 gp8 family phage protein
MIIRTISNTTGMALSVQEVRDHLRVDSTYENELLTSMSVAAELLAENKTRRALTQKQFELTLDDFPGATDAIPLPFPPLSASATDVTITYLDESSGNSTTLAATCYTVDYKSEPGRIYPTYGNEWPDVYDVRNAVTITYYSGYSTCPAPVKTWMKMRVGDMYEHRESMVEGRSIEKLGRSYVDGLLDPYIMPEVY